VQTALELPSSARSSRLTPAELSRLGHPTPGDQVYIYTAGAYTTGVTDFARDHAALFRP
jgi:hypothetical protein